MSQTQFHLSTHKKHLYTFMCILQRPETEQMVGGHDRLFCRSLQTASCRNSRASLMSKSSSSFSPYNIYTYLYTRKINIGHRRFILRGKKGKQYFTCSLYAWRSWSQPDRAASLNYSQLILWRHFYSCSEEGFLQSLPHLPQSHFNKRPAQMVLCIERTSLTKQLSLAESCCICYKRSRKTIR